MRLPKHATVVSYLALFVALGGTAYAATGGNFVLGHSNHAGKTTFLKNTGSGAALKLTPKNATTPPLAVSNGTKIKHLNADSVDGLSSGAFQRKVSRIFASDTSVNTDQAGTVGPWSVSLNCAAGGPATVTIVGPGNWAAAKTTETSTNPGTAVVTGLAPINTGIHAVAADNQQVSWTVYLQSGSTLAELNLIITANNGGLFENCLVVGGGGLIG